MISIIIPIFKSEEFIEECLNSIQKQTYGQFEVLCVNDGSPDKSAHICQKFVDTDKRFMLINQENGGVSSARNTGLSIAKGEYVCFIDSDDMIEPHYLENLLYMSKDGAFAICGYSRVLSKLTNISTNITEYGAKDFIKHILNESVEHPNIWVMMFKNSIIQGQHLDFTLGCVRNEDTEFYMKYLVYEKKVVVSDYKGYYYRTNPNSVMHSALNMKSLSSIEAQKRMAHYLVEHGIYPKDNSILSNTIQVYVYSAAKQNNSEIYKYLHNKYPIRDHMKKMLYHPRFGRRVVSVLYLTLGSKLFYSILSLRSKYHNILNMLYI